VGICLISPPTERWGFLFRIANQPISEVASPHFTSRKPRLGRLERGTRANFPTVILTHWSAHGLTLGAGRLEN
jgi:hypothetical protein